MTSHHQTITTQKTVLCLFLVSFTLKMQGLGSSLPSKLSEKCPAEARTGKTKLPASHKSFIKVTDVTCNHPPNSCHIYLYH